MAATTSTRICFIYCPCGALSYWPYGVGCIGCSGKSLASLHQNSLYLLARICSYLLVLVNSESSPSVVIADAPVVEKKLALLSLQVKPEAHILQHKIWQVDLKAILNLKGTSKLLHYFCHLPDMNFQSVKIAGVFRPNNLYLYTDNGDLLAFKIEADCLKVVRRFTFTTELQNFVNIYTKGEWLFGLQPAGIVCILQSF